MKLKKTTKSKTRKRNKKNFSVRVIFGKKVLFYILGVVILLATVGITFFHNQPPCANSDSCIKDLSGRYDPSQTAGDYMGKKVSVPAEVYLAELEQPTQAVLGATTGTKKIYVDLTNQRVYAFQGSTLVYNFIAATGKYYPTPTGTFHIWIKLRATLMQGGNPALGTHYYLPNVPYTMYLYNDAHPKSQGYGVHGAYWLKDSQFGSPQSHGCINLHIEDAHQLYDWADPPTTGYTTYATDQNPGTEVDIYGITPGI